jgi:hypothetical protein
MKKRRIDILGEDGFRKAIEPFSKEIDKLDILIDYLSDQLDGAEKVRKIAEDKKAEKYAWLLEFAEELDEIHPRTTR